MRKTHFAPVRGLALLASLLLLIGHNVWAQGIEGGLLIDWKRETLVPVVSFPVYRYPVNEKWTFRVDGLWAFEVGENKGEVGYGVSVEWKINREMALFGGVAFLDEIRRLRFDEIEDNVGLILGFRFTLGD